MSNPTIRELVEFRERYGLEAYLVWCCAVADLPAWMLMNYMRIGRHFGSLPGNRFDRAALVELVRRPMLSDVLTAVIDHSEAGEHVSLELVLGILAEHGC